MAGRPSLRLGQHGKISRTEISKGTWIARCRFRDTDGVTRIVERQSPDTGRDQWGKKAEDALLDSLKNRQPPNSAGEVGTNTKITALIDRHIDRLEEDGKAAKTIDTYRFAAEKLAKLIGGLRVGEATPPRIDAALRSMRTAHGATMARHSKTLLKGGLHLAVMAGALPANPVRDVAAITSEDAVKGAPALDADQLLDLLAKLRACEFCIRHDLVDPITLLIATGVRRSELLGALWTEFDPRASMLDVGGKLVRVKGEGLVRVEKAKSKSGERQLPLPKFATEMLIARRRTPYYGEQKMLFPSNAGTWRDPDNFNGKWREARALLGFPDVTSHSFRKSLATLIDEGGLSARVGADHLGHSKVSMTQDVYMARGRSHSEVADLLDATFNFDG